MRLHRAGLERIPHELYLQAGDHLMLAGWEADSGSLALYWVAQSAVLAPSYRTAPSLTDATGREVALYTPQEPDTWRALQGDLVRVAYPIPAAVQLAGSTLTITLYPAEGDRPLDTLEVLLDEP